MTNFFSGLDLSDKSSPAQILKEAQAELVEQSDRLLDLVIQNDLSPEGHITFVVHACHVPSNRTVTLFSVVHRQSADYPVAIEPREGDLQVFLKKSYYRAGMADYAVRTTGREVTNEWVCETPSEFRTKLRQAFELGTVKSELVSLVSGTAPSTDDNAPEP